MDHGIRDKSYCEKATAPAVLLSILSTVLSLLAAPAAHAKFSCEDWLVDLWSRSEITVELPTGPMPLTLSLDSEVAIREALRVIEAYPDLRKKLDGKTWMKLHFPLRDLLLTTEFTAKQFPLFALRRGVAPDQARYALKDLNRATIDKFVAQGFYALRVPSETRVRLAVPRDLSQLLNQVHKKIGWTHLWVAPDDDLPEIRYLTFEKSPSEFLKTLRQLDKFYHRPATHVHIGIPEGIEKQRLIQIVQLIEARIVLRMAKDDDDTELAFYRGTTLNPLFDLGENDRGVIRFTPRKWQEPGVYHDLEIRQHLTLTELEEDIGWSLRLIQSHAHLKQFKFPWDASAQSVPNPSLGHLHGALVVIGTVLSHSLEPKDKQTAQRLKAIAALIGPRNVIDTQTRKQIANLIVEEKLDSRLLNSDLYVSE